MLSKQATYLPAYLPTPALSLSRPLSRPSVHVPKVSAPVALPQLAASASLQLPHPRWCVLVVLRGLDFARVVVVAVPGGGGCEARESRFAPRRRC